MLVKPASRDEDAVLNKEIRYYGLIDAFKGRVAGRGYLFFIRVLFIEPVTLMTQHCKGTKIDEKYSGMGTTIGSSRA